MIAELLPSNVAAAESHTTIAGEALFPEETALIARAVPKRQAEFATARHCAHCALAKLDVVPVPILRGPGREPVWPPGVVGSITHCAGYHAAAVGRAGEFRSLGIDAEPNEPLPAEVFDRVAVPSEQAQLLRTAEACLDRVLFSAKESLYKAWFPLAQDWLDFDQAHITLRPDGTFDATVTIPGPLQAAQGRWLARDGLIITALTLPALKYRNSMNVSVNRKEVKGCIVKR